MPRATIDLLDLLTGLIEYRDPYFRGASSLTRHLAAAVGRRVGLGADELYALEVAALLRDLGRMAMKGELIPPSAMPGESERLRIQRHVPLALELLESVELPAAARDAIRHHHEHWDGTGYPDCLAGEQIPRLARVLAVADAFGAMISARPYRPPKRVGEALRELREGAGTLYDPWAVTALIEVIETSEFGGAEFGLRHHILVVHPDEPRAVCFAIKLCSRGYLAELAPDLAGARARLQRAPVEAVLLAGGAADGEAVEFVRELRHDPRFETLPVVGIDLHTAEERVGLLQAGADACFSGIAGIDEVAAGVGALIRRMARARRRAESERRSIAAAVAEAERRAALPASGGAHALHGSLRDFPLAWLLQAMQYDGRTVGVDVRNGTDAGVVVLEQGVLRHAQTNGTVGDAAFRTLLGWTDGSFSVRQDVEPGPRTVETPLMHLILQHAKEKDEAHVVFGSVTP